MLARAHNEDTVPWEMFEWVDINSLTFSFSWNDLWKTILPNQKGKWIWTLLLQQKYINFLQLLNGLKKVIWK